MKKIQTKVKAVKKTAVKKTVIKKSAAKKTTAKKTALPKKKIIVSKAAVIAPSESYELAKLLAELSLTKKATDVKILDLRNLTTIADFFVICTAHSDTQVKAVAEAILDGAKEIGERAWHKEGLSQKTWVLLDFVDVVVHVFLRDTREFYSLEKLWGDAFIEDVADPED